MEFDFYRHQRAALQQSEAEVDSSMDWYDTTEGSKRRLKIMVVEAAAQRRALISKVKEDNKSKTFPTPIPKPIPMRHILEDIDVFFEPDHLRRIGSPIEGYRNVKRQLMKLEMYCPGKGPVPKAEA